MIIEPIDNVAVAIESLSPGDAASYQLPDGTFHTVTIQTFIPLYHKFAVRKIGAGEKIIKYAEHIGEASVDINPGEHVHIHNVISVRENLV